MQKEEISKMKEEKDLKVTGQFINDLETDIV